MTPTIGDGWFQCLLENDRAKGIELMKEAGVAIPPTEEFDSISDAKAHIKKTGKRFVFKPDGGQDQDTATTYVSKSAEDLLEYIDKIGEATKGAKFILQEFIKGTEISVEGWFNGEDFYCLNATLEEKKFMNDGVGPNTGCSGNLVFTLTPETRLYKQGLAKLKPLLKSVGFRGMIDLNTIVTPEGAYGLEWTPRFGYDASATLFSMYAGGLGNLLHRVSTGQVPELSWKAEFGASVRLSVPPYPTEVHVKKQKGIPIKGIDLNNEDHVLNTYMYDVVNNKGILETAGHGGFIAAPIAIGNSPIEAFEKLDSFVKSLTIPDVQYRTDIKRKTSERYLEMLRQGWI